MREKRQREYVEKFLDSEGGILNLCPRFGKTKVGIDILKELNSDKVLIAYPDINIKSSWEQEMKRLHYANPNVVFTSFLSLKKHVQSSWDIIIVDEIHLLSGAQILELDKYKGLILGMTGTLSSDTERIFRESLDLRVIAKYPMEQAIKEGVVCDYEINVKLCKLDNKIKKEYKTKTRTEKEQFEAYGKVIEKLSKEGKDPFFLRLARMRIIQSSIGKINATRELLDKFEDERVLVFCGLIDTANTLGCPVFSSKSSGNQLKDFASGKGSHLAVVKLGNTGITYKPLNKVVINYFDSNPENLAQKINRCMSMEYGNPEKKASIWLICTDEQVEIKWLKKALEFFESSKIKYES